MDTPPNEILLLPQLPFVLPSLTFLLSLQSEAPGEWQLKLRFTHLESGKQLMRGGASVVFKRPGAALAPIRVPNVSFQAVGMYDFIVEVEGQPDPIITHINVDLALAVQGQNPPMS